MKQVSGENCSEIDGYDYKNFLVWNCRYVYTLLSERKTGDIPSTINVEISMGIIKFMVALKCESALYACVCVHLYSNLFYTSWYCYLLLLLNVLNKLNEVHELLVNFIIIQPTCTLYSTVIVRFVENVCAVYAIEMGRKLSSDGVKVRNIV